MIAKPFFSSLLMKGGETLGQTVLEVLTDMPRRLGDALSDIVHTDFNALLSKLRSAVELETSLSPLIQAFNALSDRVPEFLLFNEDARDLSSNYSIAELRSAIPTALANLAEVAGLDFTQLFSAIDAGQTSRITTMERRASRELSEKFKSSWKQSGIEVALRVQQDILEVQIVNNDAEFTPLKERSDGLRQFVALQMFSTRNHLYQPILLIDEADQRLHYDAQADLVQMLASQKLAPKVIYTTHSAGCLPEDLGNGVRMIVPRDEDASSVIVNRFWSHRERGLTPLLIGLGASTMAFFPTRRAVMAEGPSDMLLYPTLFREALGRDSLGFQFVPGLSQIGEEQALSSGTGVLYLVDGDSGGQAIKTRLLGLGINQDDIHVLRSEDASAHEIEDFIREDLLIKAANTILEKWHRHAGLISELDGEEVTKMDKLKRIFAEHAGSALPKIDLAYGLLDLLDTDPKIKLLDSRRNDDVFSIATSIVDRFEQL